jgi:hypothetical protein
VETLPAVRGRAAGLRRARLPRPVLAELSRVLAIYLASRLVQLFLVGWMAPADGPSIKDRLLVWDGTWFVRVAAEGYPHGYTYDNSGVMVGNGLAFFPGYPLLIRGGHALGLEAGWAALAISFLAAAAASLALYLLGRDLAGAAAGRRVGYALVVLFCAQPMSVVLSMGYSEATFCALAAGALLAARRRRWLTAGLLGLGASLTRPMGLAVAVALAVAAALALRERPGPAGAEPPAGPATMAGPPAGPGAMAGPPPGPGAIAEPSTGPGPDAAPPAAGRTRPAARTRAWRPVAGALLALAGVPGYLAWVGLRVGHPNAWFTIQTAGWGTTTDWGRSTVDFVVSSLRTGTGWIQVSVALLLIASLAAVILAVRLGTWPPLIVYGLLAYALVVGQAGYYHSKPRLLVPVLLTLVPGAALAGRSRPRAAALALCGYAAFGLWYGAYMITVWPYTI